MTGGCQRTNVPTEKGTDMTASKTDPTAANAAASFGGDAIAARLAPVILAAMALLVWFLTATGALSSARDALGGSEGPTDAAFYELINSYDARIWDDCFGGPLEDFMPAAIDTSNAAGTSPEEALAAPDDEAQIAPVEATMAPSPE